MLTLKQLKEMAPGTKFSSGFFINSPKKGHPFITVNPEYIGMKLKWIAKRGDIHDWAIYVCPANRGTMYCLNYGTKIVDKRSIRKLVPCTDEALEMYRY